MGGCVCLPVCTARWRLGADSFFFVLIRYPCGLPRVGREGVLYGHRAKFMRSASSPERIEVLEGFNKTVGGGRCDGLCSMFVVTVPSLAGTGRFGVGESDACDIIPLTPWPNTMGILIKGSSPTRVVSTQPCPRKLPSFETQTDSSCSFPRGLMSRGKQGGGGGGGRHSS